MRIQLFRRARYLATATALASTASLSAAVTLPKQADICDQGRVDRRKLVNYLLDMEGVSRQLEDWAVANRQGVWADLEPRERMIADPDICKDNPVCSPKDKSRLTTARQILTTMLNGVPEAFENPAGISEPRAYLATAGTGELRCRTKDGAPVEMPGSVATKYSYTLPLRIRGSAESLMFPREDQSGFKSAEKATLSYTNDGIANKKTEKIVAMVGYPIGLLDTGPQYAELVPFVGWNRGASKVEGQAESVTADLWRFGALLDYRTSHTRPGSRGGRTTLTHWFGFRPEYLLNEKDDSELAAFNVTYVPVVNRLLNVYIPLVRGRPRFISVKPILDLRWNSGIFTDEGTRAAGTSRDYTRLGSQVGLAITSDHPNYPVDLTITDTFLVALAGRPQTLNQFRTALSFAFDPKRYFGVEISYVHGRREDIADRESLWSIGFTVKY